MDDDNALRTYLEALRTQPDALIRIARQQQAQITALQARVAALEQRLRDLDDQNRDLRGRLETAERTAARQAAPFRRDPQQRQQVPKRPGRRAGHRGTCRPRPAHIDTTIRVPLPPCPHCGRAVPDGQPRVQYIEEVPPTRPQGIELITHVGRCPGCARRVASTHPLQVSRAGGAAGVHLGPRALALAADLHHHLGLSVRRTCQILGRLCGLSLTPGGLTQALARVATRLHPLYQTLQTQIRAAPVVHSDETSWWVGGPGHWLWVFATPTTTCYRVAATRGRALLTETLGADYPGVLVSDCLAVYDGGPVRQQKCYAHHLRAIRTRCPEGTSAYADQWRALLRRVLTMTTTGGVAPADRDALEIAAAVYLETPRRHPDEEAIRQRLLKQRDHLFTCLDHPDVPPTNNLAERPLRPAVITRKLSCGNKTAAGARTWEILTSLVATCAQRRESFLDLAIPHLTLAALR